MSTLATTAPSPGYLPAMSLPLPSSKGSSMDPQDRNLAWAIVDGHSGLGMVTSIFAMNLAIEKAKSAGLAYVGVRNSCHFGAAGYYANMAAKADMIGMAMTNASARANTTARVNGPVNSSSRICITGNRGRGASAEVAQRLPAGNVHRLRRGVPGIDEIGPAAAGFLGRQALPIAVVDVDQAVEVARSKRLAAEDGQVQVGVRAPVIRDGAAECIDRDRVRDDGEDPRSGLVQEFAGCGREHARDSTPDPGCGPEPLTQIRGSRQTAVPVEVQRCSVERSSAQQRREFPACESDGRRRPECILLACI